MSGTSSTIGGGFVQPIESVAPTDAPGERMPLRAVRGAAWVPRGVALVVLVSFAPLFNCEFLNWDDDLNFLHNPRYRGLSLAHLRWMFTTFHGGHYQPLSWLTLAVDYTLWGMQPRGYHVTNLVLHMANALLVYALALTLLPRSAARAPARGAGLAIAAAVAALGFAIHPLRVESVAWVTERRDVLSGFFLLLTVLAYVRMADARPAGAWRAWLALSLGCFVLSLLSKAWGMTLPVVLLVLDVCPLQRCASKGETWRRIVVEKIPFVVAAGAAMVLAARAQLEVGEMRTLGQYGVTARLMQAAYGLVFYLWKTVFPLHLSPLYLLRPDFNPTAVPYVLCALAVLALTLTLLWARRRWPWALAAWICSVVILSPVLGFVQSGPQLVADRYTYLACLPGALLAGAAVYRLPSCRRPAVAVAIAAVLLMLAALTFRQARIWRNGFTLWDYVLSIDPSNYVANVNRGWLQLDRGDFDGALLYYEAALRANPRFAFAYRHRGLLHLRRGEGQAAIADYTTALEIDPTSDEAYFNRGLARHTQGDDTGAIADYTLALRTTAPNPLAYNNRGFLRHQRGDLEGAIADYTRALEIDPTTPAAYFNRGLARHALGDTDGAIADYTIAVQEKAPNPQAYSNRGLLRRGRGDMSGAIEDLEAALRIAPSTWPNRAQVEKELAEARAQAGRGSP